MRARGVIQSPVLVGRDIYLALVEARLAGAAAGAGQLLFVAGEAGIGKTRLLGSAARRAQASGFTVARGAAFPGDVQSLAGLLLDLAGDLTSAAEPALSDLGPHHPYPRPARRRPPGRGRGLVRDRAPGRLAVRWRGGEAQQLPAA